jgi:RNA polymerase sigma factor (sigma-70 family)
MSNLQELSPETKALTEQHIPLARQIARRLSRRYSWIQDDDLQSYAYLGLTLAARMFDAKRGIPFNRFACTKAMFLAIDEMRKDGVLQRADTISKPPETNGMEFETPDPASDRPGQQLEAKEICSKLLKRLGEDDRKLLMMIYAERMTYREMAKVFDISESAICLRHKAILNRLRRQATVRNAA